MALRNSDAVLSALVARTIGEAQEIPMARVAQATIPSGVKAYLRANLRDRFQAEILRYGPFSRVQLLSPSTSHLHELFFAHAAEGYVYPRNEYLADLENAAHFTENYICRPRWTLASFLFHDAPVISTATLFTRLEYVTEYVYLPQLLRRMVTQKQLQEIGQEECMLLIRQIDSAVVREHTPRELALLTRPVFDYFLYGAQPWELHISLKPILLFFQDKEQHTVENLVRSLSEARAQNSISLAELADMCDNYLTTTPAPAKDTALGGNGSSAEGREPDQNASGVSGRGAAPAARPEESGLPSGVAGKDRPSGASGTGRRSGVSATDRSPAGGGTLDLFHDPGETAPQGSSPAAGGTAGAGDGAEMSMQTPGPEEPSLTPRDASSGENTAAAATGGTERPDSGAVSIAPPEQDEVTEESISKLAEHVISGKSGGSALGQPLPAAAPAPAAPRFNLERMITPEQRKRFIAVLCDRDADFYELVISRLNIMRTWSQAAAYIRELFEINSVDPWRDEAITFTDIVQQRFGTQEQPGV